MWALGWIVSPRFWFLCCRLVVFLNPLASVTKILDLHLIDVIMATTMTSMMRMIALPLPTAIAIVVPTGNSAGLVVDSPERSVAVDCSVIVGYSSKNINACWINYSYMLRNQLTSSSDDNGVFINPLLPQRKARAVEPHLEPSVLQSSMLLSFPLQSRLNNLSVPESNPYL